jgi:hypothetical protein
MNALYKSDLLNFSLAVILKAIKSLNKMLQEKGWYWLTKRLNEIAGKDQCIQLAIWADRNDVIHTAYEYKTAGIHAKEGAKALNEFLKPFIVTIMDEKFGDDTFTHQSAIMLYDIGAEIDEVDYDGLDDHMMPIDDDYDGWEGAFGRGRDGTDYPVTKCSIQKGWITQRNRVMAVSGEFILMMSG